MNIYCMANTYHDRQPSIFKLVNRDKLFWRFECCVNTLPFFHLEDAGVAFFKPSRTFRLELLINGEFLVEFEGGDLNGLLLCS